MKLIDQLDTHCMRVFRFWLWVGRQFARDKCITRASSLTFTFLLSLVPMMVVLFSLIKNMPFFPAVSEQIQNFIFENFVPETGHAVQQYLLDFESQGHKLSATGFVFLVVTVLMMMVTIENTLNAIWHVRVKRHLTASLLLYWAMLTLGPILIGASLLLSSYLDSFHWIHGFALAGMEKLLFLLPTVCVFLAVLFMYMVVPQSRVNARHAVVGALFTTVLFEVAKQVFSFYVLHFPTYRLLYGALATIPLFLLWIYISWIIFLLGAQVVNGLRFHQAERSSQDKPLFLIAYRVLGHLHLRQSDGKPLSFQDILTLEPDCPVHALRKVLSRLQDHQFVFCNQDAYLLSRDLNQVTLAELIKTLGWYVPLSGQDFGADKMDKALDQLLSPWFRDSAKKLNIALTKLYALSH